MIPSGISIKTKGHQKSKRLRYALNITCIQSQQKYTHLGLQGEVPKIQKKIAIRSQGVISSYRNSNLGSIQVNVKCKSEHHRPQKMRSLISLTLESKLRIANDNFGSCPTNASNGSFNAAILLCQLFVGYIRSLYKMIAKKSSQPHYQWQKHHVVTFLRTIILLRSLHSL